MKVLLSALVSVFSVAAIAQTEGEIIYTTKIDMHAELPDDENGKMIKSMIPQYQTTKSTLFFNSTESLYTNQNDKDDSPDLEKEDSDVQIKIEMDMPVEIIYTDVENGLVVEQKDLMDKKFLIRDTINPNEWKVTGESKEVNGLNCMKATMDTEEGKIEAWFTPQIPISSGPAGFGGLPGLIVHMSLREGNFQITATNIIPRELKDGEIKEPKNGKEISREKFEKLEQKKMEQQRKQYEGMGHGDGNVIIITE